jgi:hypothetical protein
MGGVSGSGSMTPAGRLGRAFGDAQRMATLYAPDVNWSLPACLPFPRPMKGKAAVVEYNQKVWTVVYRPDCEVKILDEVGDEASSAVRFIYRAFALSMDRHHENEYVVFVRSGPEGITEVFESFDTVITRDFFRGGAATEWRGF